MLKIKKCSTSKEMGRKGVHFKNTGKKGKGAQQEILEELGYTAIEKEDFLVL